MGFHRKEYESIIYVAIGTYVYIYMHIIYFMYMVMVGAHREIFKSKL